MTPTAEQLAVQEAYNLGYDCKVIEVVGSDNILYIS